MIRLLVIIAVVGFLTAIVTLGGAAALGGRDLAARDWQWNWVGGPGPWRSHRDHGEGTHSCPLARRNAFDADKYSQQRCEC